MNVETLGTMLAVTSILTEMEKRRRKDEEGQPRVVKYDRSPVSGVIGSKAIIQWNLDCQSNVVIWCTFFKLIAHGSARCRLGR